MTLPIDGDVLNMQNTCVVVLSIVLNVGCVTSNVPRLIDFCTVLVHFRLSTMMVYTAIVLAW